LTKKTTTVIDGESIICKASFYSIYSIPCIIVVVIIIDNVVVLQCELMQW